MHLATTTYCIHYYERKKIGDHFAWQDNFTDPATFEDQAESTEILSMLHHGREEVVETIS